MDNGYKGLSYKLLGNSNPHGRSRIFYLCHKQERDLYFEEICADIFETQGSAVIWYVTDDTDAKEYYDDLLEMDLFVAVITRKFLTAVEAGEIKEFHFAKKNRIPILPLVQEPGLLDDFNRICGEYQTLYKNAPYDPTEIPYREKLKEYLETALCPEEQTEEIRGAFDAYIFLSYRKKDRAYAQDVMRKIHQSDRLRRLAIWYDEYLVPGENFNESIGEALHKSELFVLVVTPNIVNEENYVKNVEYPMAVTLNKKIIPVEEVATDRADLEEKYQSIPEIRSAEEVTGLEAHISMIADGLSPKEHGDEARQDYLLGLSYQLGIDVEKDRDFALKMFESAIEKGSEDAYRHVIGMYRHGYYVDRNLAKAKELQLRLIALLEQRKEYLKQRRDDYEYLRTLQHLFSCYFTAGDMEREMGNAAQNAMYLDKMLAVSEEIAQYIELYIPRNVSGDARGGAEKYQYIRYFLAPLNYRNRIRCLLVKGKLAKNPEESIAIFLAAGELAAEYYELIKDIAEIVPGMPFGMGKKDIARALEEANIMLIGAKGNAVYAAIAAKKLKTAENLYDAFCDFVDAGFPGYPSISTRMFLSSLYNAMGDFENECGDPTRAYNAYLDSEDLLAQINAESPSLATLRYQYFVCKNLCLFLFTCEGDWVKDAGMEFAVKAIAAMEKVLGQKKTNAYLFDCGMAMVFAAAFAKMQKNFDESDEYLMRATQMIMESGEDDSFIDDFMDEVAPDDFDDYYIAPKK